MTVATLLRLRVRKISLVDMGANYDPETGEGAHIVLMKRAVDEDVRKRIVRRGAQWCVVSEDGSKTLGCHDTEEAALRQLRAVEANKAAGADAAGWLRALAGRLGLPAKEITKIEHEGEPLTFTDALVEQIAGRIMADLGDHVGALHDTILSALQHGQDDRAQLIRQALADFAAAASAAVDTWLNMGTAEKGAPAEPAERLARLRKLRDGLSALLAGADGGGKGTMAEGKTEDKDKGAESPEAVQKRLDDLEKRAQEAEKRAQEAEKVATEERERRLREEWIVKAKLYRGLPVKPDDDWETFKAVSERLEKKHADRVFELLRAADEALAQSKHFAEIGRGGEPQAGSAAERVKAMARSRVEKGAAKTENEAMEAIFREDPGLYRQYREETQVKI